MAGVLIVLAPLDLPSRLRWFGKNVRERRRRAILEA